MHASSLWTALIRLRPRGAEWWKEVASGCPKIGHNRRPIEATHSGQRATGKECGQPRARLPAPTTVARRLQEIFS